jgi:hypothetical protein
MQAPATLLAHRCHPGFALAASWALLLSACSGESPTGPAAVEDSTSGGGLFDLGAPRTAADTEADSGPRQIDVPRASLDSADTGSSSAGCEFPASPEAGQAGAPCTSGSDCDSGWCVQGPDGKICSKTCTGCCPGGYSCEPTSAQDTTFVCIPKLNALCRPCQADSECSALSGGALCVSYGDGGRFCGGACTEDSDCFSGYACQDAEGTKGAGKQCVRLEGECSCSKQATADGAQTACAISSALGACKGIRKCTAQGLTACDAPAPATETCNGSDDDCDGSTDETGAEGCKLFYSDADGDGAGASTDPGMCLCNSDSKALVNQGGDCNDASPLIHPAAADNCNGLDDNCDGVTDPGASDLDGDGLADCIDPDIDNDGTVNAADCGPINPNVSPTATETCNGIDDDCDGALDEINAAGCKTYFADGDKDGFGQSGGEQQCLCGPTFLLPTSTAGDCDDTSAQLSPKATEICDDLDNDCDGATDEGCDDDLDGWCDAKMVVVGNPVLCKATQKDCDDQNAAIAPGAKETCGNGVDEDCDGTPDNGTDGVGCAWYYKDGDGDGFGGKEGACLCEPTAVLQTPSNQDCNDASAMVNPLASEVCGNALDDNCNGSQDEEDAQNCMIFFNDADGDGFGAQQQACLCAPSGTFTATKGGDCGPADAAINPAASEICNGVDDNCKGGIDEGSGAQCTVYYVDKDGDGAGNGELSKCLCAPDGAYVTPVAGDCDDAQPAAKPGAAEVCDGLDNNCDGKADEPGAQGCSSWYIDGDGDGFGLTASEACLCGGGGPYTTQKGGDCNDLTKAAQPGATESCDGLDNNCDGQADEQNASGCVQWLVDADKDGFGVNGSAKCLCQAQAPHTAQLGNDCNDAAPSINPAAIESCDGSDNNCDGKIDPEGAAQCTSFYVDSDGDGYGSTVAGSKCLCQAAAPFGASLGGDCNDDNLAINPAAVDVPCNSIDENCDGTLGGGGSSIALNADFNLSAAGWTTGVTSGSVNTWAWTTSSGGSLPKFFGSKVYGTPNQGSMGTERSFLMSPVFDMTGGGTITFDTWQSNETGSYDHEAVDVSYNGGATWINVLAPSNSLWNAQQQWQKGSVAIPSGQGTNATRIRFRYDTVDACCGPTDATGWYIDNVVATRNCQ